MNREDEKFISPIIGKYFDDYTDMYGFSHLTEDGMNFLISSTISDHNMFKMRDNDIERWRRIIIELPEYIENNYSK